MNVGDRLLHIYDSLMRQSDDQQMLHAWAAVFEVETDTPHLEEEMSFLVLGLRREIALARERLDLLGVPADLTQPACGRLHDVASPTQFLTPWRSHRGNLTPPECRKIFSWVTWALREEAEADMEAEAMSALVDELKDLENALADASVPGHLRAFIDRQIKTIRSALRMYRVRGVAPIQEALATVAGEFMVKDQVLKQNLESGTTPAKSAISRIATTVDKLAKLADNLSKVKKGVEDAAAIGVSVSAVVTPFLLLLPKP
ncbi:hypothetical protein FUT87_07435 [Mitsuaria sp. TWR114]|uniref:hypothetical protein n=1 Tax=Mitsuaria sp. TWR114 TaxID=2601731 RepID=UPI0011BDF59B|nr:hypothetical protein [Mitsuaria sp. TWR114]TXD94234.1 hypothetical protein FUT87_07435 [Mitsuaria sp. TWR114]